MDKFRNGYEVAKKIREVIPSKYHPNIEMITSNPYRAPELLFTLLSELINKIVPFPPKEEWHWKAVSVLMNKTREEIEKEFKLTNNIEGDKDS